jgi:DNA-binding transcriptional ArsR family regulator
MFAACASRTDKEFAPQRHSSSRKILKSAGVVDSRREGTWVYYSITDQEHATVALALEVLTKAFAAESLPVPDASET